MKFSSKICIPIQATSMKSVLKEIKSTQKQADIIEIWLDHISDLNSGQKDANSNKANKNPASQNLEKLISTSKKPLLFVNKAKKEKGKWKESEKLRIQLLQEAAQKGAKYIDLGIHTNSKLIKETIKSKKGAKVIISFHNFTKTPSDKKLQEIVEKAKILGADIIKIATLVKSNADSLRLLQLLDTQTQKGQKMIILGMGEAGKLTRLSGCYLGNYLTFTPINPKKATASGQIPFSHLQKMKNLL